MLRFISCTFNVIVLEKNNEIKTNEKEIKEKEELDESNDEIDVDEIEKNIIIETGVKNK